MVQGSVHTLFRVVLGGATLAIALVAFLAWRLTDGPISMDALAPYVADALSADDGSVTFEIDGAILSWAGLKNNPQVMVTNINAIDQEGSLIASFPEMSVSFSLSSILEGIPSPRQVVLNNAVVRLSRSKAGEFLVGIKPSPDFLTVDGSEDADPVSRISGSANPLVASVVSALSVPGGADNPAGYLEEVSIQGATIIFSDQMSGSEWIVPEGSISLKRDERGISVLSTLPFLNDGLASSINVEGIFFAGENILRATLQFEDIRPKAFSKLAPDLKVLEGADFNVGGELKLGLAIGDVVVIDTAKLSISSGPGVLALPSPVNRTYAIERFSLQAEAVDQLDSLSIEDLQIKVEDDGPLIQLALRGNKILTAPEASVSIAIDAISMAQLKTYWPAEIKPNTKRWITQNLNGGDISAATFEIVLAGPDLGAIDVIDLSGLASLSGVAVSYMRGMPPVLDTFGAATFSQSEVVIDVQGGRVDQGADAGQLMLQEARVRLHGLETKGAQWADIDVRVDGSLRDAIALIDHEPLRYATALGVNPDTTSGRAEVLLSIDLPLLQDLTLDEVQIGASASLQETSIEQAGLGLDLEAGQFSLTLNNAGMDVTGTASLGGIRAGLAWRENFSSATFKRQYALDAVLENGQRSLIGLGQPVFAPPYVDGPIRLEAIYTVSGDAESDLIVEADLREAALRVPELNWGKEVGTEALFSSEITISDNRLLAMRRFDLISPDSSLNLTGQLTFNEGPSIQSVSMVGARIGDSAFDLVADVADDGVIDITMNGDVLDGRTFWSSLRNNNRTRSFNEAEEVGERMPFRFKGNLARVLISNSGDLQDVDASVVQTSTGLSDIQINSRVAESAVFTVLMRESDGVRQFEARSPNGGAVLNALGLGDDFVGGDFLVSGAVDQSGVVNGKFNISSFNLVDAPLLARLLSVASLTGIVDELQGTGISFSKINVPFSYSDQVFAIEDGAMYGPSIGLTARGQYDLENRTLDGDGTIVPAYAVNSALGAIPIVGPIFTGGEEGGGLFAATFAMRGNPEGGEITVNPLATLTPGFLREIFKVFAPPPAERVGSNINNPPN